MTINSLKAVSNRGCLSPFTISERLLRSIFNSLASLDISPLPLVLTRTLTTSVKHLINVSMFPSSKNSFSVTIIRCHIYSVTLIKFTSAIELVSKLFCINGLPSMKILQTSLFTILFSQFGTLDDVNCVDTTQAPINTTNNDTFFLFYILYSLRNHLT